MRDMMRISRMLGIVEKCWMKVPDWRLGQLIENIKIFSGKDDLFYMEDDDFQKLLEDFYQAYLED